MELCAEEVILLGKANRGGGGGGRRGWWASRDISTSVASTCCDLTGVDGFVSAGRGPGRGGTRKRFPDPGMGDSDTLGSSGSLDNPKGCGGRREGVSCTTTSAVNLGVLVKEVGRVVDAGITCGSELNGDEDDIVGAFEDLDRPAFLGKGGRPTTASLFRTLLGVAMTWTPWPSGFRTGFLGFRELDRLSASWAISLATSSRFGLRSA